MKLCGDKHLFQASFTCLAEVSVLTVGFRWPYYRFTSILTLLSRISVVFYSWEPGWAKYARLERKLTPNSSNKHNGANKANLREKTGVYGKLVLNYGKTSAFTAKQRTIRSFWAV